MDCGDDSKITMSLPVMTATAPASSAATAGVEFHLANFPNRPNTKLSPGAGMYAPSLDSIPMPTFNMKGKSRVAKREIYEEIEQVQKLRERERVRNPFASRWVVEDEAEKRRFTGQVIKKSVAAATDKKSATDKSNHHHHHASAAKSGQCQVLLVLENNQFTVHAVDGYSFTYCHKAKTGGSAVEDVEQSMINRTQQINQKMSSGKKRILQKMNRMKRSAQLGDSEWGDDDDVADDGDKKNNKNKNENDDKKHKDGGGGGSIWMGNKQSKTKLEFEREVEMIVKREQMVKFREEKWRNISPSGDGDGDGEKNEEEEDLSFSIGGDDEKSKPKPKSKSKSKLKPKPKSKPKSKKKQEVKVEPGSKQQLESKSKKILSEANLLEFLKQQINNVVAAAEKEAENSNSNNGGRSKQLGGDDGDGGNSVNAAAAAVSFKEFGKLANDAFIMTDKKVFIALVLKIAQVVMCPKTKQRMIRCKPHAEMTADSRGNENALAEVKNEEE